jgi:hypothetical protein
LSFLIWEAYHFHSVLVPEGKSINIFTTQDIDLETRTYQLFYAISGAPVPNVEVMRKTIDNIIPTGEASTYRGSGITAWRPRVTLKDSMNRETGPVGSALYHGTDLYLPASLRNDLNKAPQTYIVGRNTTSPSGSLGSTTHGAFLGGTPKYRCTIHELVISP